MTQSTTLHDTNKPTIDVAHAAQYLGVSERTIRRLVAGRAIGHRRLAGLVRFTQGDLDGYVRAIGSRSRNQQFTNHHNGKSRPVCQERAAFSKEFHQ